MPEHKPVKVGKVTYNNIRQAWRELSPEGLPEITVRKRLDMGWAPEDAFMIPSIPPQLRRMGHNIGVTI